MSKTEDAFFERAKADQEQAAEIEAAKEAAEWWNFEGKGGEEAQPLFVGYFVDAPFIEKEGSDGKYTCILAYLRDIEGVLWKAWFSAGAAIRQFKDNAPAPESMILINYEGEVESNRNKGRKFKSYRITVDKQDGDHWMSLQKAYDARRFDVDGGVRTQAAPTPLAAGEAPF